MGEHYYTNEPSVKSNPKTFRFTLRNFNMIFTSDSGVFSKEEVDFGTRVLLDSFEVPNIEGNILDVGCGYGPIGITIAKEVSNRSVYMLDVNKRAIELSKKNSQDNNVQNVTILQSDLFKALENNKFAVILSNPPIRAGKQVVHQLLEESYNYLVDKGELWIVIQKKQGAPSAIDKLKSIYQSVEVVNKQKGYFIIKAKKD